MALLRMWTLSDMRGCGPDCQRRDIPVESRVNEKGEMEIQHLLTTGAFRGKMRSALDRYGNVHVHHKHLGFEDQQKKYHEIEREMDDLAMRRARALFWEQKNRARLEE